MMIPTARRVAILATKTERICRLEAYTTRSRRALTLIEMLIGMAITLVMMAAVVQLFANISQGVRNRRATMEVSAKLRTARAQLYNDLAGATCLQFPKDTHAVMPKPDSNNMPDGYFEIVEGERSDASPAAAGSYDEATSLIPSTGRLYDANGQPLDPNIVTDGGGLGDYDDILAMTVKSQTERFRGRGRGLRPGGNPTNPNDWIDMAISSPVAEIVWFATQNPLDRSEGEPGMRKVYRRVVLITPWYGTETRNGVTGSDPLLDLVTLGNTTHELQLLALRNFQEHYDISVRLENGRLIPNTLADLARREHRFAHSPNNTAQAPNIAHFPHHFPYDVDSPNFTETPNEDDSSLRRLSGDRAGEDLILNNVLAFDVQVYDPGAPLIEYGGTNLQPGDLRVFTDAARSVTATAATASTPNDITPPLRGFGAYVDLGWDDGGGASYPNTPPDPNPPDYQHAVISRVIPTAPAPLFQRERRLGWHPTISYYVNLRGTPAVYDTWTTHYETDQSNQELAPFYVNMSPPVPWTANQTDLVDQGANGLDDIVTQEEITLGHALNGPDDPNERETSPPYPYPLYGVQVKIRLYEPESRQIRETTVTRNLAK